MTAPKSWRRASLIVIAAAALAACSQELTGNGDVVTETRTVSNFSTVDAENGIHVILAIDPDVTGDVALSVTTDSNLQERLKTTVSGERLKVHAERTGPASELEVSATIDQLTGIAAANGALVTAAGTTGDLTISAANGAIVQGGDLAAVDVTIDGANGALIEICATGRVTGEIANGAVLNVLCGGSIAGVVTSNGGIVRAR